jgi:glutamate transport system substrate-binding protein
LGRKIDAAITQMEQDGSWQRAINDNTRGVNYKPNMQYNPPKADLGKKGEKA